MSEQQRLLEADSLENVTPEKWYQYPWVWFLICVPLSAVVFGIVMIVSANYQPDDLVVDNYYKEGMGINRRLRLDNNAATLGARVRLDNVTDEGAVFKIQQGSDQLVLSIFHVSDRSRDLEIALDAVGLDSVGNGIYIATSRDLATLLQGSGLWYIEVSDQTNLWRLRQRISTPVQAMELVPE